jgi:hypothetical protein
MATAAITYNSFAWYNGGWASWSTASTNGYIGYNSNLSPYYTVSCIKLTTPSFVGTSSNLSVKLKIRSNKSTSVQVYVSLSTSPTGGGTTYVGSKPGTDSGRVYSKLHTISDLSPTESYKTISMDCTELKSNTIYYMYISASTEQRLAEICSASSSTVSGTLTYSNPQYTVTYVANESGGTVSNLPSNQTKTFGASLTLSDKVPTHTVVNNNTDFNITCNGNGGKSKTVVATKTIKETRTFKSWNTKEDGTGTVYAPGASYNANANLTLYAQWTVSSTTTYSNNKPGTTTRDTATETYTQTFAIDAYDEGKGYGLSKYEQKITASIKYTFTGWNSKADGTGTNYSSTTGFIRAFTIYAQWSEEITSQAIELPVDKSTPKITPINVSLDANGGTVNNKEHLTLTGHKIEPWFIIGWSRDDGKETLLCVPISGLDPNFNYVHVYDTPYEPKGSHTWYAIFNRRPEDAFGSNVTLPTPVRPGYIFVHWVDADTGNAVNTSTYKPMADDSIIAVWSAYGGARIFNDNESAGLYLPFIYTNGEFKQCLPYVYTGGAWHLCGG